MLETLRFACTHGGWLAGQAPAHRMFRAALERPEEVQRRRLLSLLRANRASAYGRRWSFDRIATIREFQDAVPVVSADDLRPWIDAIRDGRPGVLTVEPVLTFEKTGGSTGGAKYVPYTASLLVELRRALAAWMVDLYRHRPALVRGGMYWSVSPAARKREVTPGGIPVGFDDDTQYFGRSARHALSRLILTPRELAAVGDVATSRYITLRFLLDSPHLSFISVWNPSFLTLLVDALDRWAPQLIEDVTRGSLTPPAPLPQPLQRALARRLRPRPDRARELAALLRNARCLPPRRVWPRLGLISCWTSAAAKQFVPELEARFPGVEIQGKGLLATEGVVSIPLVGCAGAALAVTSHFYEFTDLMAPTERPRLAHELESGRTYGAILTTGGGLYRYVLGDAVRVVGHVGRTPLVEFVGRTGNVSDLCGEKLAEPHVARALETAAAQLRVAATFLMLAPEWGHPPRYALFVEAQDLAPERLQKLAACVEAQLMESPTYACCRALGQLGPVDGFRVGTRAMETYLARCAGLGQRVGAIKPTPFHTAPGWSAAMTGSLV